MSREEFALADIAHAVWWSGKSMDAPQYVPAGSMCADDFWVKAGGRPKVEPVMANREDDWAWMDCPYSGARIRVPFPMLAIVKEA